MANEMWPQWNGFFSHKFKKAGYRYELLTNRTGDIIKITGPHFAGVESDITVFDNWTDPLLEPGETLVGDKIYVKDRPERFPKPTTDEEKRISRSWRGRHEGMNGRLKRFKALTTPWRHDREMHGLSFRAIAITCQLELELGVKALWEL